MNIRKVKNNWAYDFMLEGKRYRKAGFKTKNEAKIAGNQAYNDAFKGDDVDKNRTFNDYYDEWIETNDKYSLSHSQANWYKRAYKYVNEYLGENIKLKDITRQRYQRLLNDFGKGRTKESVRKMHVILSQILRDATYDNYIAKDPTHKIKVNGSELPKKEEDKYIKIQEYLDLIEYFKSRDEKSYILLYVLAITGGRFSEVNRMKYSDLKLNEMHLPGTKTDNADRTVEVNAKDLQLIKNKLANHPQRIDGYLFNLSYNAVKKCMANAKKQIGMQNKDAVTTYALRHTHCSYLISEGVSIEYISKRLGHATISITQDVYAHLLDEHRKEQGDKVRKIFS